MKETNERRKQEEEKGEKELKKNQCGDGPTGHDRSAMKTDCIEDGPTGHDRSAMHAG